MPKWEYCRVAKHGITALEVTSDEEGVKVIYPYTSLSRVKAIARLGQEGWEMIGFDAHDNCWFKRPIKEQISDQTEEKS